MKMSRALSSAQKISKPKFLLYKASVVLGIFYLLGNRAGDVKNTAFGSCKNGSYQAFEEKAESERGAEFREAFCR